MINETTLNSIRPIVEQLDTSNHVIYPIEESPITALNTAGYSPVIDMFEGESGFEEAWLNSLRRAPVTGAIGINETTTGSENIVTINLSTHSRSMDEAATLVAGSVRAAMRHARTVASPSVSEMIESMDAYLQEAETTREPYEIVDLAMSKVWANPVVVGAIDKHQPRVRTLKRSDIKAVTAPDDLAKHIITGAAAFDMAFQAALKDTGLTLIEIYKYLFESRDDLVGVQYPFYLTRNKNICAYLLASILLDKPVPKSGLSGMEWETQMHNIVNLLGDGCAFIVETEASDRNANKLHYGTDDMNGKVYLNAEVYDRWLNDGGSPEIILGALLNQRDQPNAILKYHDLIENKTTLLRVWETYHVNARNLDESKRLGRAKDGAYATLVNMIDNTEESMLPPLATALNLYARAKECVADIGPHELNDMGKLCLNLVCDVLYYHTPSKHLLNRINDRADEGMAVDEAATEVMVEYITDWIASGLVIAKQG